MSTPYTINSSILVSLLIKYQSSLISRDFILDYFTDAPLMTRDEVITSRMARPGKLYRDDETVYVVTEAPSSSEIGNVEPIELPARKLNFYDRIRLSPGMIVNYEGSEDIITTLGVFIVNHNLLVVPFGSVVPYQNGYWDTKRVEDIIAEKVIEKKIHPRQIYTYVDCAFSIGSLNDICVPSLTEKTITARPEVDKLRDELFETYKDQLNDPNVMLMIENELVNLDKKLMEGDDGTGFLISGKNYDVQRKRMFLMMGMLDSFGEDETSYSFSKTTLNNGWNLDDFAILSNDIRNGSYNRAKNTALGGAESKYMGRNFQESVIVEDDCGTRRGIEITLTSDIIKRFVYRSIVDIPSRSVILLTPDILMSYMGKTVILRSPMYCATQNGYCYTCMDIRFKALGIKQLNTLPIDLTSRIMMLSMKKMHGVKANMLDINNLNDHTFR